MRHLELVMPGRDVSQRLHLGLWPGRKRLEHGALVGQERQTPIQLLDYGGDLLAGRAVPSIILNRKRKNTHTFINRRNSETCWLDANCNIIYYCSIFLI
jgi:hypothetical protein